MVKKSSRRPKKSPPVWSFSYGKRTIRFIADKVIIFRLMRKLHGRFWGITGLLIMLFGLMVCLLIKPDMFKLSTAFSDFGRDVRTAPYLAASLFFGAYGLWRWREYLRHTLKHPRPVTSLVGLTVAGLYIAALMPVVWEPWPYRLHVFGVALSGLSMLLAVIVDSLLSKTRHRTHLYLWRGWRLMACLLILTGGVVTFGSANFMNWFQLALLGELMMLVGYGLWVADKTYFGERSRSHLSILLHKIVLID